MGLSGKIRTYRDLLVWQKSMELVTGLYRLTQAFPDHERYGLTAQMRRSAVSIPSNIAEGYGRNSTGDYIRFLRMAVGSLYELQTQMQIAAKLGYPDNGSAETMAESSREIERMMSSLINRLQQSTTEDTR